jgi:transcriptional regulator with XRE-family HTH domain
MPVRDRKVGQRLRNLRESVGLTMGDVEKLTRQLARTLRDPLLRVSKSRLSDIETKGRVPSIFCIYALAMAYDTDIRTLLA